MKKTVYIKDIREKTNVSGPFLVTKKETGISKSGKPYLNLKIMDSTGELDARVWEDAEAISRTFQKDDVIDVRGFAVAYQNSIQVNVTGAAVLSPNDYSIRDFLPASKEDPAVMLKELDAIIGGVKDVHLNGLLSAIFADAEIRARFASAPAAKAMHHPYLGGLIEHVLSICGLAGGVSAHYGNSLNKDLLLTGAILHDIGKIYELSYQRSFDYTDEGRLLGHITIGVELIDKKLSAMPDFPPELSMLLKHMLLSHHGQLEFGSPKRPKTLEALVLSYLDDLDAKVNAMNGLMLSGADIRKETGSNWSAYQRIFERCIYTKGVHSSLGSPKPSENGETETDSPIGSLFK